VITVTANCSDLHALPIKNLKACRLFLMQLADHNLSHTEYRVKDQKVNSTYMSSLFGPLDILCSFLAQE
jgi:hypothetical protein